MGTSVDNQLEVKPNVVLGQPEHRVQVLPRATSGPQQFIRRKAEVRGSGFQTQRMKCHQGPIVHTAMGKGIEKPPRAPRGYLFPQTHGNCLIANNSSSTQATAFLQLQSARDVSQKPAPNRLFFPIRYLRYKNHCDKLV